MAFFSLFMNCQLLLKYSELTRNMDTWTLTVGGVFLLRRSVLKKKIFLTFMWHNGTIELNLNYFFLKVGVYEKK